MPSMANITVKKADNTTDVVYTALTPSAGDTVAAIWRHEEVGVYPGLRKTFRFTSRFNGPRTGRRVELTFVAPVVVTDVSGNLTSTQKIPLTFSGVIPQNVPVAAITEAIAQATNLLVSTLIRDSLNTGYAPT